MFFTISKTPSSLLKESHTVGKWIVSTDKGWQTFRSSAGKHFRKGLGNIDCEIIFTDDDWQIITSGIRRFPLWRSADGDTVSNIQVTDTMIHNPHTVSHRNNELQITFREPPSNLLPSVDRVILRHDLEEQMCDNLVRQAETLAEQSIPIIAPNSNGVDCALVRATLDYCGITYKSDKISDTTLTKKHLSKHHCFWGYGQMLDEGQPHIQATGYFGDAYISRDPVYVSLYLKKWNINLTEEFDKAGQSYMRNTFDRQHRDNLAKLDYPVDPDASLIDMLINDFQVWHIDECLTWTPFVDIEFMRLCLSMDPDTVIDQCVNAGLSKSLIKRLSPARLEEVQQNHNGSLPV